MKQEIGNRIRITAIVLAAGLLGFTYGDARAQNPRIDSGLNSTMGYLSNIPRQPVLGEGLDDFLAGRLDESENLLYEDRGGINMQGYADINCSAKSDGGDVFFGQIDDSGVCKPPK